MALPLASGSQAIGDRGGGRADLQALHPHHAGTAGALWHRRRHHNWQRFTIPAGSRYQSPGSIHVEADASSASYFIAAWRNYLPAQMAKMASKFKAWAWIRSRATSASSKPPGHGCAVITGGPNWLQINAALALKAIDLDCNHIPDAAMTLAVMALYAEGTTTLTNIASWRVKETDRLAAMAIELTKLGASVEEGADYLRVTPPGQARLARRQHPHLRRPPRGHVLLARGLQPGGSAGAHRRPEMRGQDLPDYFEALFSVAPGRPPTSR